MRRVQTTTSTAFDPTRMFAMVAMRCELEAISPDYLRVR
jgi:hypothetical protein